MANFNNLSITVSGAKALFEAQSGKTLTLSKIGLGSGYTTGETLTIKALVAPKMMIPISETRIDSAKGCMNVIAKMTNESMTEGFYWRETGLFFKDDNDDDILFAYACITDDKYDYIPPFSDQRYMKQIRIANIVTNTDNITVEEPEGLLYVDTITFDAYKADMMERITEYVSNTKQEIAVERSRIDNLSKMEEGSTTGDAELQDIRVGADGKIYDNAGGAVRGQIANINTNLSTIFTDAVNAHVWEKFSEAQTITTGDTTTLMLGSKLYGNYYSWNISIPYGSNIGNLEGEIVVGSPKNTINITSSGDNISLSPFDKLKGKYALVNGKCYMIPETCEFSLGEKNTAGMHLRTVIASEVQKVESVEYEESYGHVASLDKTSYPEVGLSDDYRYEYKGTTGQAVSTYLAENHIEETDPTVPDWAKNPKKPTYNALEVGALPDTTKIPSKTSDLENDSGFLTEHQDISGYALKSEIPKIDATLTESGKAADAKVTGENFTKLKSDLADLQETVGAEINVSKDFEWIKGQWASGVFADNGPKGTHTHSTKNKYKVPKGTVFISNSTWVCHLGLYDSDLTFLKTITISDGYVFEEDAFVTLGINKANKTTFTETDRLLAVKENRFCIPEKNLSKEVTNLKEQGIGGGSSIPQEQKSNFANAIRNEIAFTSTSHPYADAFLAWLESGSDTPVTPPYADISASFSGGILTISGVPTITNTSFTNGILSLS